MSFMRRLAVFIALMVVSVAAQADITAYAFGNAQVYKDIMDAASGLVTDRGFLVLIYGVAVFTVIVYGGIAAGSSSYMLKIASFLFLVLGVVKFGIEGKTNVHIYDPISGTSQYSTNVPNLVAYPAGFITNIGHTLTSKVEQYFSDVDDSLKVSTGGGFNLGNSLIKASTTVYPSSRYLRSTINRYMDDCIVPELSNGRISINDLLSSDNLWGSGGIMSNVSPSLWTVVYTGNNPSGSAVPCVAAGASTAVPNVTSKTYPGVSANNAFDYISQYFKQASEDWFIQTAGVDAATKSRYLAALGAAKDYLLSGSVTGSTSTSQLLEQSAGINMLNSTIQGLAAKAGVDSSALAFGVAQAEAAQKASWASSAVIFNDLVGYIFAVLQVFVVGILPVIIAMSLMPGGLKIAINYGLVILWVATWEPLLAIINYTVLSYSKGQYSYYFGNSYTYDNLPFISAMSDNFVLAASFLATVTPMISWGIIKGGMAFTSFVASALGQQYASMAGGIAATGNIAYNNRNIDTATMNKYDTVHQVSAGFGTGSYALQGASGMGIQANSTRVTNQAMDQNLSAQMKYAQSELTKKLEQAREERTAAEQALMKDAASLGIGSSVGRGGETSQMNQAASTQQRSKGYETAETNASQIGSTKENVNAEGGRHETGDKTSTSTGMEGRLGGSAKSASSTGRKESSGISLADTIESAANTLLFAVPIPHAKAAGLALRGVAALVRLGKGVSRGRISEMLSKVGGMKKDSAEDMASAIMSRIGRGRGGAKLTRDPSGGKGASSRTSHKQSDRASWDSSLESLQQKLITIGADAGAYIKRDYTSHTSDTQYQSKEKRNVSSESETNTVAQTAKLGETNTASEAQILAQAIKNYVDFKRSYGLEVSAEEQRAYNSSQSYLQARQREESIQKTLEAVNQISAKGFNNLSEMENVSQQLNRLGVNVDFHDLSSASGLGNSYSAGIQDFNSRIASVKGKVAAMETGVKSTSGNIRKGVMAGQSGSNADLKKFKQNISAPSSDVGAFAPTRLPRGPQK